jgi:radical SAM protein with 4Fe4S-binding SPASM domain
MFGKYFFHYTFNRMRGAWYSLTRSTKVAMPGTIMLELSAQCNLRCVICPREHAFGKEMDMGYMDPKVVYQLLDETIPYLDSVALTGLGETLMYKELKDVIEYIKSRNRGINIFISTNATYKIARIDGLEGKIDTLQISTDGVGEVYESIRKHTHFSLFEKNVAALAEKFNGTGTGLLLNMVVTKENHINMQEVVAFAEKHKVPAVKFTMFNITAAPGIPASYYDFYKSAEFKSEMKRLKDYIKDSKTSVEVEYEGFGGANGFQSCGLPWNGFYVAWNGEVPPCCAKPFPKILSFGTVKKERLIDVINSPGYRNFRTQWFKNETPEFCKKCHLADLKPIDI